MGRHSSSNNKMAEVEVAITACGPFLDPLDQDNVIPHRFLRY